tara:strand:- start:66 stop:620 length:555 start_codon:yes stop_codon:yes gene_type:complete
MAHYVNKDIKDGYWSQVTQTRKDRINGRVDIMSMKGNNKYQMFQESSNSNANFKTEAVKTIISSNPVSQAYFSQENINLIQRTIRYQVWLQSGKKHIVGKQSDLQLQIIMRSYYLQYSKNQPNDIKGQVTRLNNMVIAYSVPAILSSVEQFIGYKKAVSQLPEPMARSKNVSNAGTKTLMPNLF